MPDPTPADILTETDTPVTPTDADATPAPEPVTQDAPNSADGQADANAPSVPEKYDFTFPEGYTVDESTMGPVTELFKAAKLPQDMAQKFVDLHTKMAQDSENAGLKAWNDLNTDWANATRDDPEIGGADLNAKMGVAKKALAQFGDEHFGNLLKFTGAGNHPSMLRFLYRIGKLLSEDKIHLGQNTDTPVSRAKILFPDMN